MASQPVPSSERMLCIYPAYINSKKTIAQGRRIPKNKACDNPTYNEIKDVCLSIGLKPVVESNKLYPRELHRGDPYARGRVRIDLEKDGSLVNEAYPDKKALMLYLAEMIPKLKSRSSKAAESSGHSQQSSKSRRKKR